MKFLEIKRKDTPNHTLQTWVNGVKVWITNLVTISTQEEYRVSFEDGVVRYFTLDEFKNTNYEPYIEVIKKLSEKIDETNICVINGEFYTRK